MSDLRSMIIARIRERGPSFWVLDAFHHLVSNGASPDDAIKAMDLFVDEMIEKKKAQQSDAAS
ncbi:hypothetical protein [Bradyrhizobium sp. AZCC 2289]|uniref:hypothetical protein n=1 Tax=Bradyrhizobium sp. AZCC 2289 TaxID=3117026 RepID=UPI002FEFBDBF